MKRLLRFAIAFFAVAFVIATAYNDYQYSLALESADSLFVQQESEFLNDWYDEYEQDVSTTESNQQANEKGYINYSPDVETDTSSNPLDDLEVPVFTSGLDAYVFAEQVLALANGLHIEVSGKIDTNFGISQTVKNIRKQGNDGSMYAYNATYGSFFKMGFEAFYNGRQFKTRTTSSVTSGLNSQFANNWSFTSLVSYANKYGSLPNQLNYIVNQNTVLSEEGFVHENGVYKFVLNLNPNTSTERYKYTIKENSGASDFPKFESVKLEVVITDNARFQSIRYRENYNISTMGITANTTTNMLESFLVINDTVTIETPSGF